MEALTKSNEELRESMITIRKELETKDTEIKQRDRKITELEQSVEDVNERYRRRSEEADRLRDDIKMQAEQLTSQQSRLKEAQILVSELQAKQLPTEYELSRAKHENEGFKSRIQFLEKELQDASSGSLDNQRELSTKISELESSLVMCQTDNSGLRETVNSLKEQVSIAHERLESNAFSMKSQETEAAEKVAQYIQELDAQKRMTDLYKKHFEDASDRIIELENGVATSREANQKTLTTMKDRMSSELERAEEILAMQREDANKRITELEKQLAEIKNDPRMSMDQIVPYKDDTDQENKAHAVNVISSDFSSLTATEMYDRVIKSEKLANSEASKRKDTELYLHQILRSIEQKTPMIAAQRRDYHRILESHTELTKRLDEVILENSTTKEQLILAERKMHKAITDAVSLEQLNKDLGQQVQFLLKKGMAPTTATGNSAGDVISNHLVTFENVQELQTRNMQLLQITRKLSDDQEKLQKFGGNENVESLHEQLEAANRELTALRDARIRTEDMVLGLVQQRDMYRAMVEDSDKTGSPGLSPGATRKLVTAESPQKMQELQMKVAASDEEKSRLTLHMGRLEDQVKSLEDALESARKESSSLRKEAAYATAEAKFQSERALNFEETAKTAQQTVNSTMARRAEVEGLLVAQQKESRILSEKILQMTHSNKNTEDAIGRYEIEAQVSKASEQRLMTQVAELREELKRQASLSESMLRIEQGLASRMEEEKNSLTTERDMLLKTVENLRKDLADNSLLGDQKVRSLEEELKSTRAKVEEKSLDHGSVKEQLIREQGISAAAQERGALLEKQLATAQERLASIQGANTMDLVDASTLAQKELALSRAETELESVKTQLASADQHIEQFKMISASTERTLNDLREKFALEKKTLQDELASAQKEFIDYKKEHENSRAVELELLKEVEELRESLVQTRKDHTEAIAKLNEENDLTKLKSQQAVEQMETLQREVSKFQLAARTAAQNYERELQLHAQDAAELRKIEEEVDKVKTELEATTQRLTDISADAIKKERQLEDERNAFEKGKTEAKENLATLQRTNDLLHTQIQQYAAKIEKFESGVQISTSEEGTAGLGSSVVSAGAGSNEEVNELRQNISNLQEVMRNMKRERDLMEPKLSAAESEKIRIQGTLTTTQKLLDETRAELKKEVEKRINVHDDASYAKLMSEVTQLNIVRESNTHLRSENQDLAKQVTQLTNSLNTAKNNLKPLQEQVRKLNSETAAQSEEIKALTTDAAYWKDRLHTLVSRYNDVDPEEHKQVMTDLDTMREDVKKLQSENAALQTEIDAGKAEIEKTAKDLAAEKDATVQAKKLHEAAEKRVENFRAKLTNFKNHIEKLQKDKDSLADQNAELTTQLANAKKATAVATKKGAAAVAAAAAIDTTSENPEASKLQGKQTASTKAAAHTKKESTEAGATLVASAAGTATTTTDDKSSFSTAPTSTKGTTSSSLPVATTPTTAETNRANLLEKLRQKKAAGSASTEEKKVSEGKTPVEEKKNTEEKEETEKKQPAVKKAKLDTSAIASTAASDAAKAGGSTSPTPATLGATTTTSPIPAAKPSTAADSKSSTLEQKDETCKPVVEKKETCKFFARNGKCKFGDNCEFSHDLTNEKNIVCTYFANGQVCKFGDQCRFSHELQSGSSAPSQSSSGDSAMEIDNSSNSNDVKDSVDEEKKDEKKEEEKSTDVTSSLNVNAGIFSPQAAKVKATHIATTTEDTGDDKEKQDAASKGGAFLENLRPPSPSSSGVKPPTFGSGTEKLPLPSIPIDGDDATNKTASFGIKSAVTPSFGSKSSVTPSFGSKSSATPSFGSKSSLGGGLLFKAPTNASDDANNATPSSSTNVFGGSSAFSLLGKATSTPDATTPASATSSSILNTPAAATPATTVTTQEEKKMLRAARFLGKSIGGAADATSNAATAAAVNPFAVKSQSSTSSPLKVGASSMQSSRKRPEPSDDDSSSVPATKTMKFDGQKVFPPGSREEDEGEKEAAQFSEMERDNEDKGKGTKILDDEEEGEVEEEEEYPGDENEDGDEEDGDEEEEEDEEEEDDDNEIEGEEGDVEEEEEDDDDDDDNDDDGDDAEEDE